MTVLSEIKFSLWSLKIVHHIEETVRTITDPQTETLQQQVLMDTTKQLPNEQQVC